MMKKSGMSVFLLINYLLIRFLYGNEVENLLPFGTYSFEIIFVAFSLFYFKDQLSKPQELNKQDWFFVITSIILGFGVCEFAQSQNLVIPYDLTSVFSVFILLVLGPILEELIFRQALWYTIEDLFKNKWLTLIFTSALFSFAHFHSYFLDFDSEVKRFILFQTVYTLALGFWWGLRWMNTKNPINPIALHIGFNFGFYIGTLV